MQESEKKISQFVKGHFWPSEEWRNELSVEKGQPFEGRIEFLPKEYVNSQSIQELEGQSLFGSSLYLHKIHELSTSPNNSDVLVLKGLFIPLEGKIFQEKKTQYLELQDKFIPLEVHNFNYVENSIKGEKPQILLQEKPQENSWARELFLAGGLLILITFYFVFCVLRKLYTRRVQKRRDRKEKRKMKRYWEEKFKNAQERQDFEDILKHQSEWANLFKMKETETLQEFSKIIENIQYKKTWQEDEVHLARNSFKNLRSYLKIEV